WPRNPSDATRGIEAAPRLAGEPRRQQRAQAAIGLAVKRSSLLLALGVALLATLIPAVSARADVMAVVPGTADVSYCYWLAREKLDGVVVSQALLRRPDGACLGIDFLWLKAAADGTVVFATQSPDQGLA